jgi:hypothetical protein
MKQRDTIFCDNYIDKIFPPKYYVRRSVHNISQNTGIDFNQSFEIELPKGKPQTKVARNLNTSIDLGAPDMKKSKGSGLYHKDFLSRSYIDNTHGIPQRKKHIYQEPTIKSIPPQIINLDILKYRNPVRRETISKYMGSSQMKTCMTMDNTSYYRGVMDRK